VDRREPHQDAGYLTVVHASVLVTGGSGLLGVNWAVTMRDRVEATLAMHGRMVEVPGVRSLALDLAHEDAIVRQVEALGVQLVVHTAGLTSVEACEADPSLARHVNVEIAATVARACARAGVALAHISTDHLFGGDRTMITETDPVTPTNVYGRTKAEAEGRVLDALPEALVVRTNFYGWGPRYRRSFSDHILDTVRAGGQVTLFHDVTYCPSLAQPLIEAIHDLAARGANGICHVVGDEVMTKLEFGTRLLRRFVLPESAIIPCSIADKPGLVQRPLQMGLSNARATQLLGRRIGGPDKHLDLLWRLERGAATADILNL
jgi:dTDP-4-dehydrorhamnose reductase